MSDYLGLKCISCGNKFEDGDDIVVCPECGTPYHRECYKKEGKCINTELHEKGEGFKTTYSKVNDYGEKIRCPRCGTDNNSLTLFCEKCGMPLSMPKQNNNDDFQQNTQATDEQRDFFGNVFNTQNFQINFADPLCGLNPEEEYDGVKLSELADFVGNNTYYYLPMFKRVKDTKHKMTLNFSAVIAPTLYFAYRKMYLLMALCFLLKLLISIPPFVVMLSNPEFSAEIANTFLAKFANCFNIKSSYFELVSNISAVLSYVIIFVTGAFSNWMYYKHAVNKIKKLKNAENATKETIKAKGGVSQLSLILMIAAPIILTIIVTYISTFINILK